MLTHICALGLVILEAFYGAAERDEYTQGLEIDVTVPLQALVNKCQLYIPGRRSKVRCLLIIRGSLPVLARLRPCHLWPLGTRRIA